MFYFIYNIIKLYHIIYYFQKGIHVLKIMQTNSTYTFTLSISMLTFEFMRKLFFSICFCFTFLALFGQGNNFEYLSIQDGLGQSHITSIYEAPNGLLFLSTNGGGFSTYNGQEVKTYNVQDGLKSNFVKDIISINLNQTLIATEVGVQSFQNGEFTTITLPSNNPILNFQTLEGKTYLITTKELYEFTNGQWNLLINIQGQEQLNCLAMSGSFFYLGSNQGLKRFKKDDLKDHETLLDNFNVTALLLKEDGSIVIGTKNKGIQFLSENQHFTINQRNGLSNNQVNGLLAKDPNTIWVSTNNGVTIWENVEDIYTYQYLNEKNGLSSNQCTHLLKDSWNNLWIGTANGGASKYAPREFFHFNKSNGLAGNKVYAIGQDNKSNLWVANDAKGATKIKGNKLSYFDKDQDFVDTKINAIHNDRNGQLWLGTDNGLMLIQDSSFQIFSKSNGLNSDQVTDVVSFENEIWISTFGGGLSYANYNSNALGPVIFKSIGIKDGLVSNTIVDIEFDQNGMLWYASQNRGVGMLNRENLSTFYNQQNGLSSDNVNCIAIDSLNNIWVGTNGNGLNKIFNRNKKIIHFKTKDGLTSNIVKSILSHDQALWIGNEKGVDKLRWNLNKIQRVEHFGVEEGFAGIECIEKASFKDQDGRLWFGTVNGLMKYDAGGKAALNSLPKVFLQSLKVNNTLKALAKTFKLSPDENTISIQFSGSDLGTKGKLNYQWALNNEDWSTPNENQEVFFSNLDAGAYSWKVRAINRLGAISEHQEINFSIQEAWAEKLWVKALLGLVGLLLLSLFIRWRIKIAKRKIEKEKAQLQLEKDLISLENKALQLQMNPHFIFNCLNSIQGQIGKVEDRKVKYNLAKFSKLMRSILNHSRQERISLQEEIDLLINYLGLEQISRNQSFDFSIDMDESIDPETTMIPPLMMQPFVENAIIHGVGPLKDRKGHIQINFKLKGQYLLCEIQDNGIGRAAAKEIKSQQANKNKSVALKVNSERLDLLHKDKKLKALEIEDLKDNGNAVGTLVKMHLPMKKN